MANYLFGIDQQLSVLGGIPFAAQAYPPYGALVKAGAPTLGFAGQRCDPVTGNYPLGNGLRLYSPALMRFISPDWLSPFAGGGINAYAYCGGDPVNRTDPGGLFWRRILGALSSSATGAGAVLRTLEQEALRLQDQHRATNGHVSTYAPLPVWKRISNVAYFTTGAAGVAGNVLQGAESSWVGEALISVGSGFGIANAGANMVGGITANQQSARNAWALMGQPGIPSSSVVFGTFVEVTGMRMLGEAVSYAGRQSWTLVSRLSQAVGAGINAWRQSGTDRPPANIQMTNVRGDRSSP